MTSDPLYTLLRENRPVPDAAFENRVMRTLRSLPEPQKAGRIRSFAVRRPLVFAAILILLLSLCVGAGLAVHTLFRNVFSGASEQLGEQMKEQHTLFEQIRESLNDLPEEVAGETEAWLDFREDSDRSVRHVLDEIASSAVVIGQAQNSVILSEFAIYDAPGMDAAAARHLFFGFSGSQNTELPETVSICIDGMTVQAFVLVRGTVDAGKYAVYDCIPMLEPSALPDTSLLNIDGKFCFRVQWETRTALLPQSDAEKTAWLAQSVRLAEAVQSSSCVCLTDSITKDGLTVSITELSLEGNVLTIEAEIEAAPELSHKHADVVGQQLRIRNRTFSIGVSLFVSRLAHDDFDFSKSPNNRTKWAITLPYAPSELQGEVITFGFQIETLDLNPSPDDEPNKTSFFFELKLN